MAGLYARRLADQGFVALTFDFRFWGQSDGAPREYESPESKIIDIKSAVSFLSNSVEVDPQRVGGMAVCASSQYMACAAAEDRRIKSFVAVAPWIHDADIVRAVYGGEEGVRSKIDSGNKAKDLYTRTGIAEYVPACSASDPNAAMFGEFDYYLDDKRGAIPQWTNRYAVMSWSEWLNFDSMPAAKHLTIPVLFVHSGAAIPDGAKRFYANINSSNKRFVWLIGDQFDFYDREPNVSKSVAEATKHFNDTL